jgi:hypothetical protein
VVKDHEKCRRSVCSKERIGAVFGRYQLGTRTERTCETGGEVCSVMRRAKDACAPHSAYAQSVADTFHAAWHNNVSR